MGIPIKSLYKIVNSSNKVRIWYLDGHDIRTRRDISPIGLSGDNDYLRAYCHLREDYRNFLSSNITSFQLLRNKKKHCTDNKWKLSDLHTCSKKTESKSIRLNDRENDHALKFTSQTHDCSDEFLSIVYGIIFCLCLLFPPFWPVLFGNPSKGRSRGSWIPSSNSRRQARVYYHNNKSVGSTYKSDWL